MKTHNLLTFGAVLFAAVLLAVPEAEARRGWRRARSAPNYRTTNHYSNSAYRSSSQGTYQAWQNARRPSMGPVTYSGVSRAEQDFWRRRDAWYDHAHGGWKPEDFR